MVVELYECWDKVIIGVMVRVELGLPWYGIGLELGPYGKKDFGN